MIKKRVAKSLITDVSLQEAEAGLNQEHFRTYLHLLFAHPTTLRDNPEGYDIEALRELATKGYIKIKSAKITVLKRLRIPANEHFSFFRQTPKHEGEALHNLVIQPFDNPNEVVRKAVFEHSKSVNKKTGSGGTKNGDSGRLSSKKKNREIGEALKTKVSKKQKKGPEELVVVNIRDFSGNFIQKVSVKNSAIRFLHKGNFFTVDNEGAQGTDLSSFLQNTREKRFFVFRPCILRKRSRSASGEFFSQYKPDIAFLSDLIVYNPGIMDRHQKSLASAQLFSMPDNTSTSPKESRVEVISEHDDSQLSRQGVRCAQSVKCLDSQAGSAIVPSVARKKLAKRGKMNLQKLKENFVAEKKERSSQRKKTKALSEKDIWEHIKKKDLDVFGPYVDRTKILKILELPGKSSIRRELVEKLGKQFSDIYFAYRQKLAEKTGTKNTYSSKYEANLKYAQKAAEACVVCGVTPQFVIKHFHEARGNFNSNLNYVPLSMLSNHAMIDSAASSYLAGQKKSTHGNSYEDVNSLHPQLREKLEDAGFATHEYSDRFLLTVQVNAIDIADGNEMFISSDIKGMVHWAAEHVFGGKSRAKG